MSLFFTRWSLRRALAPIAESLAQLHQKVDSLMTTAATITALLASINDATNSVAAKVDAQLAQIQALRDQLNAEPPTPITEEQLVAIADSLTAERDRLVALAADPENPVPAAPADSGSSSGSADAGAGQTSGSGQTGPS